MIVEGRASLAAATAAAAAPAQTCQDEAWGSTLRVMTRWALVGSAQWWILH